VCFCLVCRNRVFDKIAKVLCDDRMAKSFDVVFRGVYKPLAGGYALFGTIPGPGLGRPPLGKPPRPRPLGNWKSGFELRRMSFC